MAGLSARVSATLIALVLLLLAGTAGAADKQPGAYVVGDSLASGTAPYLRQQLAGWRLTQIVSIGLHTAQGAELVRERSRSLPEVVVVSLGTNDDPRLVSRFAEDVRAVVAAAGPRRCVVWPTIVRPPAVGASYVGYNVTLKHVAARHENLVVVDWVGLVRRHPAWLGRDGIHVKPAGYRARAAAIAGAVERCP